MHAMLISIGATLICIVLTHCSASVENLIKIRHPFGLDRSTIIWQFDEDANAVPLRCVEQPRVSCIPHYSTHVTADRTAVAVSGGAFKFERSQGILTALHHNHVNQATIGGWIRLKPQNQLHGVVISIMGIGSRLFSLSLTGSEAPRSQGYVFHTEIDNCKSISNTTLHPNTWIFFAVVLTRQGLGLYVNGHIEWLSCVRDDVGLQSGTLAFGSVRKNDIGFTGILDEIFLARSAWSMNTLQEAWKGVSSTFPPLSQHPAGYAANFNNDGMKHVYVPDLHLQNFQSFRFLAMVRPDPHPHSTEMTITEIAAPNGNVIRFVLSRSAVLDHESQPERWPLVMEIVKRKPVGKKVTHRTLEVPGRAWSLLDVRWNQSHAYVILNQSLQDMIQIESTSYMFKSSSGCLLIGASADDQCVMYAQNTLNNQFFGHLDNVQLYSTKFEEHDLRRAVELSEPFLFFDFNEGEGNFVKSRASSNIAGIITANWMMNNHKLWLPSDAPVIQPTVWYSDEPIPIKLYGISPPGSARRVYAIIHSIQPQMIIWRGQNSWFDPIDYGCEVKLGRTLLPVFREIDVRGMPEHVGKQTKLASAWIELQPSTHQYTIKISYTLHDTDTIANSCDEKSLNTTDVEYSELQISVVPVTVSRKLAFKRELKLTMPGFDVFDEEEEYLIQHI